MKRPMAMCRVHPDIVRAAAGKTGGRDRIMQTFGISWNSWMKISAGAPVKRSVAERFRDRVMQAFAIDCGPDGNTGLIEVGGAGGDTRSVG